MTRLAVRGERSSLRDLAYRRLRDAIVDLELEPASRITEEALAADLGVSRPVVRESLRRLEVEGLVLRTGNGRMQVSPATADEATHLYAVRAALEQLTVRAAAPLLSDADLDELSDCLAGMRATGGRAVTGDGGRFHEVLARVAANPVNDQMMRVLRSRIDRYRSLSVTAHDRPGHSVEEHQAVLDALRAGDGDAAAAAMERHVLRARDAVVAALGPRPG